ncbi:M3 family metallopeptidase [Thermoflexibacter ruber]|uniref:Thimet oligopeptidase n=1 Tax=Thermoflexibacter ruber TaxID=1003 RepID=A0A1I2C4P3_9BACT|nr:M3 family metallopeptidase [Thermoflexibacter ruber]SFE63254.1 thimet oligopeptidase [Thermoflexibacter ruber]
MKNPLIYTHNQLIDFKNITVENVQEAVTTTTALLTEKLSELYAIAEEARTFENTMRKYDALMSQLSITNALLFLLSSTVVDDELRNKSRQAVEELEKFGNQLALDENLYQAIKQYAQTSEAQQLTGYQEKFVKETVRSFEKNGFALPKEKRDALKDLQDQLSEQVNLFYKNIAEYQDFIIVSEEEMAGLPEDFKNQHKQEDGTYKIGLEYPSYTPFMQYAHSEEARKKLYIKYLNRASDKNLSVLKNVLRLRKQIVALLGYQTYAAYRQEDLMSKKPEIVWNFENKLKEKVRPKAQADYQELLEVKKQKTGNSKAQIVNPWESGYYRTILLKEKYSVDPEQVRTYFPLDNVLHGLFHISEQLFDIQFVEQKDVPVWHEEVRYFEVRNASDKALVGRLYLDLFPRPNKYNHAACFPLVQGRETEHGYQIPVLALVCNFSKPTPEKPSLLRHAEVETMFHEFGHALHVLLTQSPVAAFAGTNTANDFVEVPSQLLENWAWNYESLALFAKHYQTGEVLPKELFDKMLSAKNLGVGIFTQQQIFYGTYDMTLHDKYNPESEESTTDIIRKLQNEITLFPYLEGTHFEAAFGHLMGYAASYYGYLWSLVYADDIFSVFEQKGILNKEVGVRYRNTILSKGGSEDEMQQLINFLGREPSEEAFLKSLGV